MEQDKTYQRSTVAIYLLVLVIALTVPKNSLAQHQYYQQQQQQQKVNQPYSIQRQQQPITNNRLFGHNTPLPNLDREANYAQQQHKQQLSRHNQFLSQQRSFLDTPPTAPPPMVLINQPEQDQANSNMLNLPPSSAAITAVNFNNQPQNGNNIADNSPSAETIASFSQQPASNSISECSDKLCYGLPMGCNPPQLQPTNGQGVTLSQPATNEPCSVWVTAKHIVDIARPVSRDILFELNAKATQANTYAAVGFSPNGRMLGFVFECIHNRDADDQSTTVTIKHSYNLPNYINRPALISNGFKPIKSIIENGYYRCSWMVQSAVEFSYSALNGSTQVRREDLGYKNYHILLATGEYDAILATKQQHSDRVSSLAPVSLAQIGQLKSTASHILVRIHGSLMVIIWAGLVTSSIIIARYYKNEWANSKLNDLALWFVVHRTLMLTAWFGSIIAVIFAYMYTETYHPGVHQLCGSTCLILSTLQVLGGMARPSLESSKRVYFNWAHFIAGNLAHTFGVICLISASFLAPAHLPPAYLWVVVAFTATYAIVHIIMTIHQYVMHKSSKISITPMNDLNSNSSTTYASGAVADSYSKDVSSPFRQFMLGIFVTLAIIFVCLLVVLISNKPN